MQDSKDGGRITAEDIKSHIKEKYHVEYKGNSVEFLRKYF